MYNSVIYSIIIEITYYISVIGISKQLHLQSITIYIYILIMNLLGQVKAQ